MGNFFSILKIKIKTLSSSELGSLGISYLISSYIRDQNVSSINKQQNISLLVAEVYDKVLDIVYNKIISDVEKNKINHLKKC